MAIEKNSKMLGSVDAKRRFTPTEISGIVNQAIQAILAHGGGGAFNSDTPLMNMGLSSLELLELRDRLSEALDEPIHATFFFQYSTAKAIADYFISKKLNVYKDWLYSVEWAELPIPQLPSIRSKIAGIWLVFLDETGWGEDLISKMEIYGFSIVKVKIGNSFKAMGPNEFQIRPLELSDYLQLFKQDCFSEGLNGIVYLWALFPPVVGEPSLETLNILHARTCCGLLYITKSLTELKYLNFPKLYVLSWSLQEEGDAMSLLQSPMTGLCKAIGTEHPDFHLRRIALDPRDSHKLTVENFFPELFAKDQEDQITWREGKRLVPRLVRVELPDTKIPEFKENATYILTEAAHGLGLEFVKWYIDRGAKHLVILDHESTISASEQIFEEHREKGINIQVYSKCKMANIDEMKKIFSEIAENFPPIKGLMHIAEIIDDDPLIQLDWNRFTPIFDLKVGGGWLLHLLTENMELDHFVLFSTVGSAMGPLWRANRVAACTFLDALSFYRHAKGLPALAINWGPWSREGVHEDQAVEANVPKGMSMFGIEDGMQVLDRLLELPIPQVMVASINWFEYLHHQPLDRPLLGNMASEVGLKKSEIVRRFQQTHPDDQIYLLQRYIRILLRRILLLNPTAKLDINRPFSEFGLNEATFLELRSLLQFDLDSDIELPLDIIEKDTTIKKISESLLPIMLQAHESMVSSEEENEIVEHLHEPIAIIGMACRFPGAKNYREFWENLVNKVDSIREVPADRWDSNKYKGIVKWGGFIDDIDKFDPLFFNISPKEAAYIDPQHRIFLQTAWHAMEDAGYCSQELSGKKIGVYAGVSKNDYAELMRENSEEIKAYISTGTVHSILTNRLSYTLDVNGPSESIDTACSSALFALYSAVRDLRSGTCKLAFVGGVNALLSPTMFISHTRSGMLSEDGRCKTFDASANGYVRGEGVGVLLLKPLKEAQKDGDFIHAVIRSVAINHGGKSSGLTAPSVNAQAAVVQTALEEANIDPETITFIEVHGTGTPLGDPIEIEGLKKAFSTILKNKPSEKYCVLGAVKTNVGHCESAAGITGIIKMILSMENQGIPANLHFKNINPKISLENSPFTIATEYQDWNPVDIEKKPLPRRGGVSSFGMGGANAHVVLEEAPHRSSEIKTVFEKQLFPLSARKGRLRAYVESLNEHIKTLILQKKPVDLESIAYTLQTGRDPFEERVIFISNSLESLQQKITTYLRGENQGDVFYGLAINREVKTEEDKNESPEARAERWIKGELINWNFYWNPKPLRFAGLPLYPFEPLRCWFDGKAKMPAMSTTESKIPGKLEGIEMKIPSSQFFLKDHIIAGKSILPGVMYLELARAAGQKIQTQRVFQALGNINWISPLEAKGEFIHPLIIIEGDDLSHFKILENNELRCSGNILYEKRSEKPGPINIDEVRKKCPNRIEQIELYEKMKTQGLSQGPSLRVITEFHSGPHVALSKIRLNSSQELNEFVLHPSLMDGVYQTVVAHHFSEHADGAQQYLPYGLESIEWFGPLRNEVYAYVEELPESVKGFLKYRMKMLSLEGELLVQFEGFSRRPLQRPEALSPVNKPEAKDVSDMKDLFYVQQWEGKKGRENRELSDYLLLVSNDQSLKKELEKRLPNTEIIMLGMATQYDKYCDTCFTVNPAVLQDYLDFVNDLKEHQIIINDIVFAWDVFSLVPLLFLSKAFMQARCYENLLFLYTYSPHVDMRDAEYAMAGGFGRTLIFENPRMELRTVETDALSIYDRAEIIVAELKTQDSGPLLEVSYRKGIRKIRKIISADQIARYKPDESIFVKNGKYLISGGAGGLGKIFSKYLALHYHPHLILIGRSKLNKSIQNTLEELRKTAASVHYLSVDVTNFKALSDVFMTLPKSLQNLNGVIHAAGLKQDSFILKKDVDSFNQVIRTKVKGAQSLDALTKKMKLDFMVLFSSVASLIPNQGQSDYAAANSFLDRFAELRNRLVKEGKRVGLTRAINWPLWRSGGMQVSPEQEKHLKTAFGMDPLSTDVGIQAFEQILNYAHEALDKHDQVIVISGDRAKIMAAFEGSDRYVPGEATPHVQDWSEIEMQDAEREESEKSVEVEREITAEKEKPVEKEIPFKKEAIPEKIMPTSKALEIENKINENESLESESSLDGIRENLTAYLKESIASVLNMKPSDLDSNTDFEQYGINSIVITEINTLLEMQFKGLPKTLFFEYPNLNELINYFLKSDMIKTLPKARAVPKTAEKIEPVETSRSEPAEVRKSEPVEVSKSEPPLKIEAHDFPLVDTTERGEGYSKIYKTFRRDQANVKGFSHLNIPAVPGACFLEMARQGAAVLYPDQKILSIFNNYWPILLIIPEGDAQTQTKFIPQTNGIHFEISTRGADNQEIVHASGSLGTEHRFPKPNSFDIHSKIASAPSKIRSEKFYSIIHHNADLRLSGNFRPVQELHLFENEAIAQIVIPDDSSFGRDSYMIQPVIFTGLEQSLLVFTALTHAEFHPKGMSLMPVSIEAVDLYQAFPSKTYLHILPKKPASASNKIQRFDATLMDENGKVLAFISGNTMRISPLESEPEKNESLSGEDNATNSEKAKNIESSANESVNQGANPDIDTDIAIIGMSGRFPDAENLDEYWNNLVAGRDSVSMENLHPDLYHSALLDHKDGKVSCKYGASLKNIDAFNPEFFGIAPIEGALIDPQERLFLQVAWEGLQDVGWDAIKMAKTPQKIGVFVGVIWQDYQLIALEESLKKDPIVASSLLYSIANRVSYTFNFTGPSLSVDTACSSSLTALHLACQSIWLGEIKAAVVGGVNLNLHPMKYAYLNHYHFLSKEGKCRSYGEGGSGYVPGEGVGALIVKSLKEAIKDGDPIYAVIKGSAINHGGKTRGYTVPNPVLQSEVILSAIKRANINPREISYVEGHGTGTELGDPIEIRGLDLAYSKFTPDKQYCALGSVKSNIGHLEAAAGIASIIKVILQMKNEMLVPSLHSEALNKNVDFSNTPFIVQHTLEPWKSSRPFLAAISSFGAGGSYAHVIVENYPNKRKPRQTTVLPDTKKYWLVQTHPLLGQKKLNEKGEIEYLNTLDLSILPYLNDHKVFEQVIFPGAGYIELMYASARDVLDFDSVELKEVNFESAMNFVSARPVDIQVKLQAVDAGYHLQISSLNALGNWESHASGIVIKDLKETKNGYLDIQNLKSPLVDFSSQNFYERMASRGVDFGKQFQCIKKIYFGDRKALAEMQIEISTKEYFAHPALLDGGLQMLGMAPWQEETGKLYLPIGCDDIQFFEALGNQVFMYCEETESSDWVRSGNITYCNASGKILAKLTGMHFRRTTESSLTHILSHEIKVDEYFYKWVLQEKKLDELNLPSPLGNWLIFGDGEISAPLAMIFKNRGASCRCISQKELPKTKEAFVALLQSEIFNGILHVSSAGEPLPLNIENIKAAQRLGVQSLLYLIQALAQLEESMRIPLILITNRSTFDNVNEATINGLFKTALLEHPSLPMKQIDIKNNPVSELIFNAIFSSQNENIVIIDQIKTFVPRLLKENKLFESNNKNTIKNSIKSNSTYLITGGLGGLGQSLTRFLCEQAAGAVVLTGRKVLDDKMAKQLEQFAKTETKVSYEALDISDEKTVENLLKHLEHSEKPLKGIFHLAGILEDATLMEQNWEHFEHVFAAKVYGSYYLHRYSKGLDLFVLFSSIASMLGNPGQSNYAAANSFMDVLCQYRREKGLKAQSISWGPWAEVGMAKDMISRHASHGLIGLKNEEALRALELVLASKETSILIAHIDWEAYSKTITNPPTYLESFIKEKTKEDELYSQLKAAEVGHRFDTLKHIVADVLRKALGFDPSKIIDEEKSFFDMGLDSLMAIDVRNRLQEVLANKAVLSATAVFEYSSIDKMTKHLLGLLKEETHLKPTKNQANLSLGMESKWLVREQKFDNPDFRVFCFHFAGGGASAYRGWQKQMPENVELISIQLPGREQRFTEPLITDMPTIINNIIQAMGNFLDKPYLIFAHSAGTLVAAELVKTLQEKNLPLPRHLILSSFVPAYVNIEKHNEIRNLIHLNDKDFIDYAIKNYEGIPEAILKNPEMLKALLPVLRADIQLLDYHFDLPNLLKVPISSIYCRDDKGFTESEIKEWSKVTSAAYDHTTVPGGHLSLLNQPMPFINKIRELLTRN